MVQLIPQAKPKGLGRMEERTVGWKDGYTLVYRTKDLSSANDKSVKCSHQTSCKPERNSNLATKMGVKIVFLLL